MKFPFTASEQSIAIFFNGRMLTIPSSHIGFDELSEHLKQPEHNVAVIERLIDQPSIIARHTSGDVTVVGSTVYYKGTPVHSSLCLKLVNMLDAGYDPSPWANFLGNLMDNPSDASRQCLYNFLDKWQAPITADGHFIAFKAVRKDFTDKHTGKFDNSPGKVVEMPRENVNPDPHQTCSRGLHVCASSYLEGFFYSHGDKVLAVKVNPADVVAVPTDYGFSKMRVCRYEVVGEIEDPQNGGMGRIEASVVHGDAPKMNTVQRESIDPDWDRKWAYLGESKGLDAEDEFAYDPTDPTKTVFYVSYAEDHYEDEYDLDPEYTEYEAQDPQTHACREINTAEYLRIVAPRNGYNPETDTFDEDEYETYDADEYDTKTVTPTGAVVGNEDGPVVSVNLSDDNKVWAAFEKALDEMMDEAVDDFIGDETFEHGGNTYSAEEIRKGVNSLGQRGYSRVTGIPRTTLQGWLAKID